MATVRIQLRRGTSSQWDTANPTLAAGEIGIETDTNTFKFGDGVTDWNNLNYALSDTVDDYIPLSEKGVALGVATLDASGFVPSAQLPPLAKVTVSAVANQAARLALTVEPGDIAIQSDNGTTYVLQSSPASTDANWKEISATAAISAAVSAHESDTTNVHGISDTSILVTTTGTQTLTNKTITSPTGLVKADVGLSNVDNTSDADKPVSTAQAAADAAVASNAATALSNHESDTTNIHGIVDTSLLVTTTGAQTLTSKSLTSPELTGTPTAPTAANGTDSTQIATTEFVQNAIEIVVGAAPAALNTLSEIATSLNNDADLAGTLTASISTKVAKSGDTMTGQLDMGSNKITSLGVPTVTSDAAPKGYVDSLVDAQIAVHNTASTSVHGITNTANLVYTDDFRLTNERTPGDNTVGTDKINDLAVTTAKLANNSITEVKIVDSAVTTAKIADSAVIASKLDTGAVTTAKIADSSVTTDKLADLNVTTAKLADLNVTTGKIVDSAVTAAKIADSAVIASKLDADAVTTAKIANSAVTTAKITDLNITTAKLADFNVTSDKLADVSVTTVKIADSAVTDAKLATDSVTSGKIANGAVTSDKIASETIVDGDISASAAIAQSKISGLSASFAAKADLAGPTFTGTVTLPSTTSIGNVSATELGYVDGVTSAIQTQLDAKAPTASPTFTGTVVLPTVTAGGSIVPSTDNTYDLGSPTKMWKDLYVGPGSLYVNGQKVLQDESGNIVVSADADENLSLRTSGSGNIEFDPTGSGNIQIKGPMSIQAGNQITSSDGNPIVFASAISIDTISSKTLDTDLSLSGNGSGKVYINDNAEVNGNLVVGGNLTVSGTTTTVNSETISLADNIIDLNSNFTTGVPSENAGIKIKRGDSADVQIRWNESNDNWEFTNDGTSYNSFAPTASPTFTGTVTLPNTTSIGTVSATELGYVDGVTSAIQTQLDAKAPLASPTFTGTVTVAASGVAFTDGTQTKAGVPSLTTIGTTIGAAYNLSTGGLALRDQLIPISGTYAVTVPTNATTAYPVGTSISFYQSSGTGGNFVAASGVTILSTPGLKLRTTSSSATLTKVATDTWLLAGDLSA